MAHPIRVAVNPGVSNGDDDSATKRHHWEGKDVRPSYKKVELQAR
jgi:hypothetical protein